MAYETPLTVAEVVNDISTNRYVLPSIQREYVWDTSQIETLFDSLMQDYPIGAFLFWEISKDKLCNYDFYEFLKNYHEKTATHNQKADLKGSDGVVAVLDGQQRLTSLYVGLKGSYAYKQKYKKKNSDNAYPVRKLYLNIVAPANDESNLYDFDFKVPSEVVNDNTSYWFEVGEILNMKEIGDTMKYINENVTFSETNHYTKEQVNFAINTLSKLFNVIFVSGTISYYKEKSEELDKVLNIFIRVNSGGTVLSYSDLLLSIASAQWETHDAREEITAFVDSVNEIGQGFSVNKDFVLKASLVLSDFPNIAFKVDNFNKPNMMKIEAKWDTIKKAIRQAINLVSSFGYSKYTLPANNAIIPIAYYLMMIGMPDNFIDSDKTADNRAKIKKWLIRSLLQRAFSGQPDNVLRPIREIIKNNGTDEFPIDAIIDRFKGTNKSISFTEDDINEHLLKTRYGNGETLSTMMLLYDSLDYNNEFHIDHMYPKSKFTKEYLLSVGVAEDQIDAYIYAVNDISNLQLLAARPNEEKSNTDFEIWFESHNKSDEAKKQYRETHYLPDMDYTYDNFLAFVEKRQGKLKDKLKELLL
ncbi:MAG: DUF262 domain-containing protein [Firmicutes bacterium]|nr:DUF262 domain-containing protein [Bacillota bacterium]